MTSRSIALKQNLYKNQTTDLARERVKSELSFHYYDHNADLLLCISLRLVILYLIPLFVSIDRL